LAGDYELAKLASDNNRFLNIIKKYNVDWVVLVLKKDIVDKYSPKFEYISDPFNYSNIPNCYYVLMPAQEYEKDMTMDNK